jgi:hypothetical protein
MASYNSAAFAFALCHTRSILTIQGLVHRGIAQIIFVGNVLWIDGVLLQHVPLPVILPGERLCALPRVIASGLGAVEFAGFRVFVVDVPFQMRYRAKASPAPFVLACARPFVIAFVVAAMVVSYALEERQRIPLT